MSNKDQSTKPVDEKQDRILAMLVTDYFHKWLSEKERETIRRTDFVEISKGIVETVKAGYAASTVKGERLFTLDEMIESWVAGSNWDNEGGPISTEWFKQRFNIDIKNNKPNE